MGGPAILLIGIGAQKSGTSWLANYLLAHPEVFMSPIKELHFWDARYAGEGDDPERRFHRKLKQRESGGRRADPKAKGAAEDFAERLAMGDDPAAYIEFFRRRAGDRRVWCEITPAYSTLNRTAFAEMAAVAPDTRFVFVMRNPADRYWSHLRFINQARPSFDPHAHFRDKITKRAFALRTDYKRTLEELFAAVAPEKVHLEFFERLFTQEAVDELCRFIGIAPRPGEFELIGRTRSGGEMNEEMRDFAVRHFAPVYRYIDHLFAGDVPQSWRDDLARIAG
jgi:hypothetical protein